MLTTLFLTSLLSATPPSAEPPPAPPVEAAPKAVDPSVVIHVDGMVCSFCVQGLERGMSKLSGVTRVALSLEDKTIALWMAPNKVLSDEVLEKQIRDSGFDVAKILRPKNPPDSKQKP